MTDTSFPTHSPDVAAEARSVRRFAMLLIIVVASAMSFAQVVTSQPLQSANDRSRWATVWSLVERGTFQIDEIDARPGWGTIDKVRHDGHFYSSKPPLQSTLVAGAYWGVKRVTGWSLDNHTAEVTRLLLLMVNWLPRVLSLVVIAMLVERNARRDFGKLFVLTVASWGTLLGPFSSSLNNHFPAAVSVLLAMFAVLRVLNDGERRKRFFAIAGLCSGLAFSFELPAALLVAVFGGLLWKADSRRTLTVFVPAALVPIAAFVGTNLFVTGGPFGFYSSYGGDRYVYEHEGIPSYWSNPQGLDRNLDSPLMYFVHCTVGHHGLLSLTPVFVLTLIGWLRWNRWPECRQRTMLLVGAALTAVTLGFYLTRTQNYNYGGNSVALRWMLWLTPLWLIAMVPVFDAWGSRRGFQGVACGLLAWSVMSASLPGSNPWQSPWLFSWMERRGWINYDAPPPAGFSFQHKLWTWFPHLGDDSPSETSFVRFVGTGSRLLGTELVGSSVGEMNLVLTTGRGEEFLSNGLQRIRFVWRGRPSESASAVDLFVDAAGFREGKKSSEFLRSSNGASLKRDELLAAQRLLTGLPQSVEYHPGHIRYLKTPLRPDKAFRCQRAAAQTYFQPAHASHPLRYRCDLWLCDEIPFGVAQLELSVTDPATGQTMSFQRLTAIEATGLARGR